MIAKDLIRPVRFLFEGHLYCSKQPFYTPPRAIFFSVCASKSSSVCRSLDQSRLKLMSKFLVKVVFYEVEVQSTWNLQHTFHMMWSFKFYAKWKFWPLFHMALNNGNDCEWGIHILLTNSFYVYMYICYGTTKTNFARLSLWILYEFFMNFLVLVKVSGKEKG